MTLADVDRIGARRLLDRICAEHGVRVEEVMGHSRHPSNDRARRRFYALLRWSTGLSLPEIGRVVNRDHTTVLHSVRRYESELNGKPKPTVAEALKAVRASNRKKRGRNG